MKIQRENLSLSLSASSLVSGSVIRFMLSPKHHILYLYVVNRDICLVWIAVAQKEICGAFTLKTNISWLGKS